MSCVYIEYEGKGKYNIGFSKKTRTSNLYLYFTLNKQNFNDFVRSVEAREEFHYEGKNLHIYSDFTESGEWILWYHNKKLNMGTEAQFTYKQTNKIIKSLLGTIAKGYVFYENL